MKKKGKKGWFIAAAVLLILGGIVFSVYKRGGGEPDPENAVYVTSIASLTGLGSGNGMLNRFAGVVESQETWSVERNPEYTVAEIYVTAGQTVEEGTPLFIYDAEQFRQNLSQGEIDLERLEAELAGMNSTIEQLEKEKKAASSSDQASYTIQIQQQQLEKRQKEYDIKGKQAEIEKLKENIENAEVKSKIAGVVQSVNNGSGGQVAYGESDNSFIKIMKTGDFRVRGSVNESNIGDIMEGSAMLVHSRVDPDRIWTGTVTLIDRENGSSGEGYYGNSGGQSTSYPFYVDLDSSEELMLGQHVYMEVNVGQLSENENSGIWLDQYYIDESDPEAPFVWAAENGKLVKRPVTLGERDDELFKVRVLEGLAPEDYIAFPDESNEVGQAAIPMEEMTVSENDGEDGGLMAEGLMDGGMADEGMMAEGMMHGGAVG
ncbi:MAG: efflux RND transporter periplasmic adaptor subunit [Lachnospiraceae bacterium]|nr:efflux RND transporter periplasmic adaptor subunit [Lachnospiraceae bacterium]